VERLLQCLDDVDDLVGLVGLLYERIRIVCLAMATLAGLLFVLAAAIWIALIHPPTALAIGTVLFVTLLYRSVTAPVSLQTA